MKNKKNQIIAGVDEVGRGPLAGPVYAAAVILNPRKPIPGLTDSKLLTAIQREELAAVIYQRATAWAIGRAAVHEIDTLNIFHASMLAMKRALESLSIKPDLALIDGKSCPKNLFCEARAIVKGDQSEPAISAASIIAKVTRDAEMVLLDKEYPGYGLADHKGYSTKDHFEALQKLGASPIHRKSFEPVRFAIEGEVFVQGEMEI